MTGGSIIKLGVFGMENLSDKATIPAHYGVSEDAYDDTVRELVIEFINNDNYTNVIDKAFPGLSSDDRCKVFAFSRAFEAYQKVSKFVPCKKSPSPVMSDDDDADDSHDDDDEDYA